MKPNVLLLDDDVRLLESLSCEFFDHGYQVCQCQRIADIPKDQVFMYAVIDMRLVGEFGIEAIEKLKNKSPDCRIVVLSGYGSIQTAIESLKKGAIDYLTKPASFKQIEQALLGQKNMSVNEFEIPSLSQIEHEYIDYVLLQNDGNISRAAKALGLHRQSLQRKLKKYI
jgi:two-component system response regulator RegA